LSNKILITILFWKNDRAQAMKLARLLADLEPDHSISADILFVSRFDCKHDVETEKYAARKFNIYSYTSTRRGVGWPLGCTSIFFGAMEWIYHKMAGGKIPQYKAVLILGADSVPLRRDWLAQMHMAWDAANKVTEICAAGALIPNPARDHINGDCCMLSGSLSFLKYLAVNVSDGTVGWDWALAPEFKKRGWADFPFVKSLWRCPTFTQESWDQFTAARVSWIHGVKDFSLLELSRKNLL
jgi:hypothetical protein